MIKIQSFATAKNNAQNNGNTNVTNSSTATITTGVQGVRIWGQYHDHTADIDGDMSDVGNITANGNITTSGNVIGNQIQGTTVTSDHIVATDGQIGSLTGGTINTTGSITSDGAVSGSSGYFENEVVTDFIDAVEGNIGKLISANLTVDNLTVTNAAHFFKLVIDEIKAAKGQIIITPANAVIDKVNVEGDLYNIYFRAEDNDKKIHNMFEVGDQVVCQTFDTATGTSYNVQNKFYWALCTSVSSTPTNELINSKLVKCHRITLDFSDKATNTNGVPEVGDEIVMLGNRTNTLRQAAISIGAYNNPFLDTQIKAPFIIQYSGINDYNLSSHRLNVISNGLNQFKGKFSTTTGDDIEQLIDDAQQGAMTYMHTAYANSNDGSVGFSKTYFSNAYYIGFCSNHNQSDTNLTYQDYTWARLRGSDGVSSNTYFLQSDTLTISVDGNNLSTTQDFTVYGYKFDNTNGKVQVNNNCELSYIYEDPDGNTTTTRQLPIFISPSQEDQAFANGLKTIRLQMYDDVDEEIVAQLDIPIIRDGERGKDAEDASQIMLLPVEEKCLIDANGTLGLKLEYQILRITGQNYEYITTSSDKYHVAFKAHKSQSTLNVWTYLPYNTNNPSYTNANYQTNWKNRNDKVEYIEVALMYGQGDPQIIGDEQVIEKRIVNAQLAAAATFTITDQITSVVQGHTTSLNNLDGRITQNTNSISTINQQYNQISSTVESHTTTINNMDGRLTQNETDISNITQKADSIESTVQNLKTGAKNYFNFTSCRWQNTRPFIKAYGVECTSYNSRVINLGFDGVGGDFALTCSMRMRNAAANVNVNICNVNDPDHTTVPVTTQWQSYQFVYKNVTQFIGNASDTENLNGFLSFVSSGVDNSNRLYVKDIMVVRGNIPSDFNISWKDLENANTDDKLIEWEYNSNIVPTNERYKGYTVYKPTSYNQEEGNYTDFIFANNKALKTYTPYTLSFYAKCAHPCIIESFFGGNGGCVDGTCPQINQIKNGGDISISNFSDGSTAMKVDEQWRQFVIHWYNHIGGNRNIIAYRDGIDNWESPDDEPDLKICAVELHEGYWDRDLLNSQSLIKQTATSIELAVNSTGINIYDGSITLNAENTTINGNLNLRDTNQGLILYDEYGNPKISVQNDTLGTLENFNFGQDKLIRTKKNTTVNSTSYNVAFDTVNLGEFNAGQKLELHDFIVNSYNIKNYFEVPVTELNYNYIIKCAGTTVATKSGIGTRVSNDWKLDDYVINTLTNSGSYTIDVSISCTLQNITYGGDFSNQLFFYIKTIQTSLNKIATDGAVFSSNVDKYNWFGQDQVLIRNEETALRVKDGHIERNSYDTLHSSFDNNFSDLSSTTPYCVINQLTYNATVNDALITFSSVVNQSNNTQRILYLPHPSTCAGKQYFVKNIVGNSTVVNVADAGTNKYFIEASSNTTTSNVSIANRAMLFISCGLYWIVFYCG